MSTDAEREAELAELRRDNARLREDVLGIHRSLSWRLTSPLRGLANGLRRGTLGALLQRRPRPTPSWEPARAPLFEPVVVIFALLPAGQSGGGQRSAQLASAIARRGNRVRYLYAADSFNFARGAVEHLPAPSFLEAHHHVSAKSPRELLQGLPAGSTFLFEAPHPRFGPFLEAARTAGIRTVFELIDDWETSLGADWYDERSLERFATRCQVVTGTARSLREQLAVRFGRSDALYVPCAADETLFRRGSFERPVEFEGSHRVLLYVGALNGEWLSWEHLGAAGQVPGARVYLIGDLPHQRRLPSGVVALGPRPLRDLPRYLAHADAALIPFKPGKISDAVSPIKVFEYLFMGSRVVATSIPELRGLPGVSLAETPAAFAALCERPPRASPAELDDFVLRNGWSERAERLLGTDALPQVRWVVLDRGSPSELERCLASLSLHGGAGEGEVQVIAKDQSAALAMRSAGAELVAVMDSRAALLAPTALRQGREVLRRESGASGVASDDAALVMLRPGALASVRIIEGGPELGISAGPEGFLVRARFSAVG